MSHSLEPLTLSECKANNQALYLGISIFFGVLAALLLLMNI